jgi:hypothetical protein
MAREVSKEEFFAFVGKLDVHPTPVGNWPYTSIFKDRAGVERGRIVNFIPAGSALSVPSFFLPD